MEGGREGLQGMSQRGRGLDKQPPNNNRGTEKVWMVKRVSNPEKCGKQEKYAQDSKFDLTDHKLQNSISGMVGINSNYKQPRRKWIKAVKLQNKIIFFKKQTQKKREK